VIDQNITLKITAVSVSENVLVLGTDEGYILSYEISKNEQDQYELIQNGDKKKKGSGKIFKIQIISFFFKIALVVEKNFYLVKAENLDTDSEINSKLIRGHVDMFAIQ